MACFFSPKHFSTFDVSKHYQSGQAIDEERYDVGTKLLEIFDSMWPWIQQQKWNQKPWDLHPHHNKQNRISCDHLVPSMIPQVGSMWLHFGKSKAQLMNIPAFYHHARIEVYIGSHYPNGEKVVRTWLILTDTTEADRRNFIVKLSTPGNVSKFWSLVQPLMNKGYFYELIDCRPESTDRAPKQLLLTSTITQTELISFIKKGNVGRDGKPGFYSGIVKEYHPDDIRLDNSNFIGELKKDFTDLYPLYDFITKN